MNVDFNSYETVMPEFLVQTIARHAIASAISWKDPLATYLQPLPNPHKKLNK